MIVVVGAGPAGIRAALEGHERGESVLVIDDNPAPGGQIWRGADNRWLRRFRESGIPLLASARVIAGDALEQTLVVDGPDGVREIRYERVIVATGTRELLLPFPGWTLPGVFGAGGLQVLTKSGMAVRGKRVVVGGSGPLLIAVAAHLRSAGAQVKLIAEQAPLKVLMGFAVKLLRHPEKLVQAASVLGIPYMAGCWVESVEGRGRVERVTLRRGSRTWDEECDYVAVGYGLVPNDELAVVLGQPRTKDRSEEGSFGEAIRRTFALRRELKRLAHADTIVCRCEDVAFERLREFSSFRAAKLHTRCGMGPCQGRVCGAACEFLFGWGDDSVRPPVFPAPVSSLLKR